MKNKMKKLTTAALALVILLGSSQLSLVALGNEGEILIPENVDPAVLEYVESLSLEADETVEIIAVGSEAYEALEEAREPVATGRLAGVSTVTWRLYADGELVVSEGVIQGGAANSPWHAHRESINRIVFTGPITMRGSMARLFLNLSNVVEIEGLSYFDISSIRHMEQTFDGMRQLTSLDFSSFDTSHIISMHNMLRGTTSLRQLTLGSNFRFVAGSGLPAIPRTPEFSGNWQNIGDGTVAGPTGNHIFTSAQLIARFNGQTMADTFIWQPAVIPDADHGRFPRQPGADGIEGAPWELDDYGTLTIGAGYINWFGSESSAQHPQSPWFAFRDQITRIEITGPITAGPALRGLFSQMGHLTEIEGLTYFDTSNVENMEQMFWASRRIISLDLSSFDMSLVGYTRWMFYGLINLRELTLGENFEFLGMPTLTRVEDLSSGSTGGCLGLTAIARFFVPPGRRDNTRLPDIRTNNQFTGMWQHVGEGTSENPTGPFVFSSEDFLINYTGRNMAGTFVWQPVRPNCQQTLDIPNNPHDMFQDPETGIIWRVLVPNDGNGNALVIKNRVVDRVPAERSPSMINCQNRDPNLRMSEWGCERVVDDPFTMFEDSLHRQYILNWYNENVGEALRSRSLNYTFYGSTTRTDIGAGIETDSTFIRIPPGGLDRPTFDEIISQWTCTREDAFTTCPMSHAISRPTGDVGSGEPFALSATELNTFFDMSRLLSHRLGIQGRPQEVTEVQDRNGPQVRSLRTGGSMADWMLRTPISDSGGGTTEMRSMFMGISTTNALHQPNFRGGNYMRPALWISVSAESVDNHIESGCYVGEEYVGNPIEIVDPWAPLREVIADAESRTQANYTPLSWARMQSALVSARSVYNNTTASEVQIDGVVTLLSTRLNELVRR